MALGLNSFTASNPKDGEFVVSKMVNGGWLG